MSATLHQHCLNHPEREAVAKCPTCARPFCRECITEHDFRMICANCLAEFKGDKGKARPKLRLPVMPMIQVVAGIAILWTVFYQIGEILVNIPVTFHEGKVWENSMFDF
jgi:hypothetical protein